MARIGAVLLIIGLASAFPCAQCTCSAGIDGSCGPVVVTGATGRTGSLAVHLLRNQNFTVRALVRNVTKAREVLGCSRCDDSEGIYVGDITEPGTLVAPMQGAASLVIATSAVPICNPFPKCHFAKGGSPLEVDWVGAKAQLTAFANATAHAGLGQVVLISTEGTTSPDDSSDVFEHISFYKLNFEAALMASQLPFTIVKPCGLINSAAGKKEIIVGHDDELQVDPPTIARADVARVIVASLQKPVTSKGLRFDVCSRDGSPTSDEGLVQVLQSAQYPWNAGSPVGVDGADFVV